MRAPEIPEDPMWLSGTDRASSLEWSVSAEVARGRTFREFMWRFRLTCPGSMSKLEHSGLPPYLQRQQLPQPLLQQQRRLQLRQHLRPRPQKILGLPDHFASGNIACWDAGMARGSRLTRWCSRRTSSACVQDLVLPEKSCAISIRLILCQNTGATIVKHAGSTTTCSTVIHVLVSPSTPWSLIIVFKLELIMWFYAMNQSLIKALYDRSFLRLWLIYCLFVMRLQWSAMLDLSRMVPIGRA